MAKLISILGNRLVTGPTAPGEGSTGEKQMNVRYTSVAVVSSRPSTPALAFCLELQAAIAAQSGRVALLSSAIVQVSLSFSISFSVTSSCSYPDLPNNHRTSHTGQAWSNCSRTSS